MTSESNELGLNTFYDESNRLLILKEEGAWLLGSSSSSLAWLLASLGGSLSRSEPND
jgi:hypothetical protein